MARFRAPASAPTQDSRGEVADASTTLTRAQSKAAETRGKLAVGSNGGEGRIIQVQAGPQTLGVDTLIGNTRAASDGSAEHHGVAPEVLGPGSSDVGAAGQGAIALSVASRSSASETGANRVVGDSQDRLLSLSREPYTFMDPERRAELRRQGKRPRVDASPAPSAEIVTVRSQDAGPSQLHSTSIDVDSVDASCTRTKRPKRPSACAGTKRRAQSDAGPSGANVRPKQVAVSVCAPRNAEAGAGPSGTNAQPEQVVFSAGVKRNAEPEASPSDASARPSMRRKLDVHGIEVCDVGTAVASREADDVVVVSSQLTGRRPLANRTQQMAQRERAEDADIVVTSAHIVRAPPRPTHPPVTSVRMRAGRQGLLTSSVLDRHGLEGVRDHGTSALIDLLMREDEDDEDDEEDDENDDDEEDEDDEDFEVSAELLRSPAYFSTNEHQDDPLFGDPFASEDHSSGDDADEDDAVRLNMAVRAAMSAAHGSYFQGSRSVRQYQDVPFRAAARRPPRARRSPDAGNGISAAPLAAGRRSDVRPRVHPVLAPPLSPVAAQRFPYVPSGPERPDSFLGRGSVNFRRLLLHYWNRPVEYSYEELLGLDENISRAGMRPAESSVIDSLEVLSATAEEAADKCCSICLDDIEVGVSLKRLPCKHVFHPACIDQWLARNRTCPMCKGSVTVANVGGNTRAAGPPPARQRSRAGGSGLNARPRARTTYSSRNSTGGGRTRPLR